MMHHNDALDGIFLIAEIENLQKFTGKIILKPQD